MPKILLDKQYPETDYAFRGNYTKAECLKCGRRQERCDPHGFGFDYCFTKGYKRGKTVFPSDDVELWCYCDECLESLIQTGGA